MKKFAKVLALLASIAVAAGVLACKNTVGGGTQSHEPKFVTISAGKFIAGSENTEVTLTKNFLMCDHEVTQKEWCEVFSGDGENPSSFTSGVASGEDQENRPVENVNWYMAIAYCNKRSIKEGLMPCYSVKNSENNEIDWANLAFSDIPINADDGWNKAICDWSANGYRLPTEAEWEYAARGGLTGNAYAGTDDDIEVGDYAWYASNSDLKTHEVRKKKPNGYGLYDMSGNVWEWCWDWYGTTYPSDGSDPVGASSGSCRVGRGGSWDNDATILRASYRYNNYASPTGRNDYLGFRLARSSS